MKLVIFDMDGVLIDSEIIYLGIERGMYKELGIKVSHDRQQGFVGSTTLSAWTALKAEFNFPHNPADIAHDEDVRYLKAIHKGDSLVSVPYVKELLDELESKNIKLALASSSSENTIKVCMQKMGFTKYFSEFISGDYVGNSKPAPDIFLYTAKLLNVDPKDCIVIEDSTNGIKAAKSANMKCIGFDNINTPNQVYDAADLVIDDFRQLDVDDMLNL